MVESGCRDCEIRIEDIALKVDLILFELDKLDAILGMNFLTKYHAILDCSNKEVVLRELGKFEVKWRHTAYLAHVIDTQMVKSDLENVPIVREYLDVFPEELSRLAPKGEIEITIDVLPRTTPISQTPYRMAPSELKELKDQLEELLEKGYIQPSTLPWGIPILFVKKKDGSMRLCIDY
ncbi:DNA/RNA polymerases superfamily protein [Cucumis melo var. makuwa]|uniref:DNA/RNA polymerases superfamily protein n=1 Tax=Cucumis melo var. makuwa TaxID=1194695 RepID=A0A5A7THJ0_CUCMM|nr:DNA/RNA polymerases superfamily protein [Cucumis melo var. makuwa]